MHVRRPLFSQVKYETRLNSALLFGNILKNIQIIKLLRVKYVKTIINITETTNLKGRYY